MSNVVHLNTPRATKRPPLRRAGDATYARALVVAIVVVWSATCGAFGYLIGVASRWP
jgi:hypothetical protein